MSNKPTTSLQHYIRSDLVRETIENSVGGENAGNFTTSLLSVVNTNPVLQECEPAGVIKAAITAAGMNLPVDPNLGFAFIIPYRNGKTGKYEAQFQLGYKGFIQLAQRSGQFKRINATEVKDGEYVGIDRRSGEVEFDWIEDEEERRKTKTVGYLGYFRLLNGFEKELYMSVEDMTSHAKKYSQSFKKGYGLWVDQFDVMAKKTVLKLLISKYGALSTNLQKAIRADQSAIGDDTYDYIDNKPEDDKDDSIDGEVVEDPKDTEEDVDQTPKKPTEAEAPQESPDEDENTVECPDCDDKFKSEAGLKIHRGQKHKEAK